MYTEQISNVPKTNSSVYAIVNNKVVVNEVYSCLFIKKILLKPKLYVASNSLTINHSPHYLDSQLAWILVKYRLFSLCTKHSICFKCLNGHHF